MYSSKTHSVLSTQAILQAFQILLANLPRKLLSYPSVTVACIGAVRMLCEEAPEKFSKLPPESFGAHPNQPNQVQPPEYVSLIMSTLQWGINHSDMVVVRDAVRAVAEVVVEHKQEHSEGRVGLSLFLGPGVYIITVLALIVGFPRLNRWVHEKYFFQVYRHPANS